MNCQGNGRTGMDADPGHGRLISQGCLPAGVNAPDHALVPHPRATLRTHMTGCTQNNGRPRRREGNDVRISDPREAHRTHRKFVPRHNPTDLSNINGEAVWDQLTVSYQLLPRSGRSLGGKVAQYRLWVQDCHKFSSAAALHAINRRVPVAPCRNATKAPRFAHFVTIVTDAGQQPERGRPGRIVPVRHRPIPRQWACRRRKAGISS
jgi:hypothetical protein